MKTMGTTVDIKIAGAVAGKLVNASVMHEVEHALGAYPDANQLIISKSKFVAGAIE
jgi:hypothetical protein